MVQPLTIRTAISACLALACLAPAAVFGAEVDFLRDVKPILAQRCYRCHSSLEQESGLRLDSVPAILKGGEGGQIVVAGKSGESRLIEAVLRTGDLKMPPEGPPLTEAQIATLRAWIDAGALAPPAGAETKVTHWSFTKPVRPPLPRASDPAWSQNPIDAFVAAKHAELKLTPVGEAPPNLLLRRLYIDLIGLPPTVEELDEFLSVFSVGWERRSDGGRERRREEFLRGCRRQTPRQPPVRRALGPALDGRLAVQRLGRLRQRRSARASRTSGGGATGSSSRSTPTSRTTGWSRDAGGRRAGARRPASPAGHRLPGAQLVQVQPQQVAGRRGRAHRQGVPRGDVQLLPLPRPHVRPARAARVLPVPGHLRAARRPHRPRSRRGQHRQRRPGPRVRRQGRRPDVPVHPRQRQGAAEGPSAAARRAQSCSPPSPLPFRP